MKIGPLVSIIIPNYNRAKLIGETLDSILSQTHGHWECFVIDDGSTDNSEAVVRAYCKKDERIKFYKRPDSKPKGANACRNYGLELSKGHYINWFDSDDLMHPDKLELQVAALEEFDYPFSVCQSYEFYDKVDNELALKYTSLTSDQPFEDFLAKRIVWLTQAPLFKKDFLIINNLVFDEALHAGQEWEFFARVLFNHDRYNVINQPLVYVRRHAESISDNPSNDKLWFYYLARYKVFKKFDQKLSPKALLSLNRNFLFFYKNFIRNRTFKNAFIVWRNCLIYCRQLGFRDHFNLFIGFILYYFFNKGEGVLSKVSLYQQHLAEK